LRQGFNPPTASHHPLPPLLSHAMHYPQLVSTTVVSAGMIAKGAVVATGPVAAHSSSRGITC